MAGGQSRRWPARADRGPADLDTSTRWRGVPGDYFPLVARWGVSRLLRASTPWCAAGAHALLEGGRGQGVAGSARGHGAADLSVRAPSCEPRSQTSRQLYEAHGAVSLT